MFPTNATLTLAPESCDNRITDVVLFIAIQLKFSCNSVEA